MKRSSVLSVLVSVSLVFVACTDDEKKVEEAVKVDKKHEFTVEKESGLIKFKAEIVYFNFDDSSLTKEGMERLKALADYIEKKKDVALTVEGHCDERGSIEYNLALGEKRAASVLNYLQGIGVKKERLQAVSFGEEKPSEKASNEKSWAMNRRAEFRFAAMPAQVENPKELKGESIVKAQPEEASQAEIKPVSSEN